MTEIMMHVTRQIKAEEKTSSGKMRERDGSINDFLEQRRPFINPTHDIHTH